MDRKNCWTIAEHRGGPDTRRVAASSGRARWDADAVRDDLRDYVVAAFGDQRAVLVVDETGDVKKGTATVGRAASIFGHGRADRELAGRGVCDLRIRRVSARTSTRPARAPPTTPGAVSNYKNLPGEPVDHALGRSRGGWTTKIHALIDASCAPLTVTLTPGQAGDNPQLASLLTRHSRTGARDFRCWPIRPTPTTPPATTCGNAASHTPSPSAQTRSHAARPRDHTAVAHRASTRPPTGSATPSSEVSTASNTGEAWPPATTRTP